MSLESMLGLNPAKKIRYAIVGLGDISQESLMPGVNHTGNSEITAFVTSDAVKAKELAQKYGVEHTGSYEEFPSMLASGTFDAIYLATPNWRHAEFAVPALKAGVHVLLEKPMEVSSAKCQEIIEVQKKSGAKLMIAYRLHFEPATLAVLKLVREGEIGKLRYFSSVFSMKLKLDNHRAKNGDWAGPAYDLGPYPINAVRNLFGSEPVEVYAIGSRHADSGLDDFDDTIAVTLRFPEDRVAQFIVSYVADSIGTYTLVGTEGSLVVTPAYTFGDPLCYELKIGGEDKGKKTFKATDQFGGELKYFSDQILQGKNPEPDGEEGLLDVRVIEAIYRSIQTGEKQMLPSYQRHSKIDPEQEEKLRPVKASTLVHVDAPTE